jgi:hypothetical protein
MNIEQFFKAFNKLRIDDQRRIIDSFEERYEKKYSDGKIKAEYFADLENLKLFSKRYDDSLQDITHNPQELQKKQISERLHELIIYFEKTKDK